MEGLRNPMGKVMRFCGKTHAVVYVRTTAANGGSKGESEPFGNSE